MEAPSPKYWPSGTDTVEVKCPWCGAQITSFIGVAREIGDGGLADQCSACDKDVIVEAFEHGVLVFEAEIVNVTNLPRG